MAEYEEAREIYIKAREIGNQRFREDYFMEEVLKLDTKRKVAEDVSKACEDNENKIIRIYDDYVNVSIDTSKMDSYKSIRIKDAVNGEATTRKIYNLVANVTVNFKQSIFDILKLAKDISSISNEKTVKNLLIILNIILSLLKLSTIKLTANECYVIKALHDLNAYTRPVDPAQIGEYLDAYLSSVGQEKLSQKQIENSLTKLDKLYCINIKEGNVELLEMVRFDINY